MLDNLTIDNILKKICNWFNKDRRIVFFSTFVIGMLVHFMLYSNQLLAYDAYWHYGSFLAKGWEVSLGRFLIPFIDLSRGTIVNSLLTSFISITIMCFTTLILCDLLKVKKIYIKILIGILLVVTPTFSLTLMYSYTADSYTFAMLFSVLSVYFLNRKNKKNLKNIFLALICIVATLGFYQAYLCVIVTLCVITYIINLCSNDELTFKDIAKKILFDIGILLIGTLIYYICYTILVKLLNLNITNYNGGNKILSIETLKNLLPSIKNTYVSFYEFYFKSSIIENNEFVLRNYINLIMFIFIILNFVIIVLNNKIYKKPYKLILLIILLLMFPIFSCVIEIIAQEKALNLLMSSALYLPIALLLKQVELLKNSKFNNVINIISTFIVIISLWSFILSDNATYVATDIYNKQMSALGNRIIAKIENTEGLPNDNPICIIGKMNFNLQNSRLLKLTNFDVSDINMWTWQIFLQDNLALGRNICTFEDYQNIFDSEDYKNMGIFPNENSIKLIDGITVVKISY